MADGTMEDSTVRGGTAGGGITRGRAMKRGGAMGSDVMESISAITEGEQDVD